MAGEVANKVVFGGETVIDLTQDTIEESYVASGKTFHRADGKSAVGTAGYTYDAAAESMTIPSWAVVLE